MKPSTLLAAFIGALSAFSGPLMAAPTVEWTDWKSDRGVSIQTRTTGGDGHPFAQEIRIVNAKTAAQNVIVEYSIQNIAKPSERSMKRIEKLVAGKSAVPIASFTFDRPSKFEIAKFTVKEP